MGGFRGAPRELPPTLTPHPHPRFLSVKFCIYAGNIMKVLIDFRSISLKLSTTES